MLAEPLILRGIERILAVVIKGLGSFPFRAVAC